MKIEQTHFFVFQPFHVRFCQATFVTFFQFSYIRSVIPLTHVAIGVVFC